MAWMKDEGWDHMLIRALQSIDWSDLPDTAVVIKLGPIVEFIVRRADEQVEDGE